MKEIDKDELLDRFNTPKDTGGTFCDIPLVDFSKEQIIRIMYWNMENLRKQGEDAVRSQQFINDIRNAQRPSFFTSLLNK